MNSTKTIMLISSGQPSLNPRLVKEADALSAAGFKVIVLYAYWNAWGTKYDIPLLAQKAWKAIRAGGDPKKKRPAWFFSRAIFKTSNVFIKHQWLFKYFADWAASRSSLFLIREAKKHKANLYVAHNIGALPAAYKTANYYKKPCGFDAEDFHRQELTDDVNSAHFRLIKYLEDKYLPLVNYITASSPFIARQYAMLYNKEVAPILNVFPKTKHISITNNEIAPLKLFWFSQTVGPNRGLETIIEALGLKTNSYELHLLGDINAEYQLELLTFALKNRVPAENVFFYKPVEPDDLFNIASQFDIGLAAESGACLNRRISLTNKLFTYIQSGLAVVASNTEAQTAMLNQYPAIGFVYKDASELSVILNNYHLNRGLLFNTKKEAFKIGQAELNWEAESRKFISIVDNMLTGSPSNDSN